MTVAATGEGVEVSVDGAAVELSRSDADDLREAIGRALADRTAFRNTVARRRPDGSYVVARRGADSAGNRVVFGALALSAAGVQLATSGTTAAYAFAAAMVAGALLVVAQHAYA